MKPCVNISVLIQKDRAPRKKQDITIQTDQRLKFEIF